ncbi:MAG: YdeI/OmpD-associated family protein, partial [Geminicoccaceae bacterium]
FMLPLSAANRAGAGLAAGDEVEVEVTLDTAPREVVVPADFAAALDADRPALEFFDGLSFSNKQSYLLWIAGAKTQETRDRRVAQAVELLSGGRAHR